MAAETDPTLDLGYLQEAMFVGQDFLGATALLFGAELEHPTLDLILTD